MSSQPSSRSELELPKDSRTGGSVRTSGYVSSFILSLVSHGLNNGLDVTDLEGKSQPGSVAFNLRRVVRHQHTVISDLPVYTGAFEKVDVAFVGISLTKVQPVPNNVTEMHVEDFLA